MNAGTDLHESHMTNVNSLNLTLPVLSIFLMLNQIRHSERLVIFCLRHTIISSSF